MLLTHAASVAATAVFATGRVATLPTISLSILVVGALVVAPVPTYAQVNAFGAPQTLQEAARADAEAEAKPAAERATVTQAPAFAAPVPAAAAPPAVTPTSPAAPPSVAPAVAAQAAPIVAPSSTWRVEVADTNVRRVIERWSRTAGMQVIYESNRDVDVGAAAAFSGTYEHALQQLFAAIESSEMPLRACLYANAVTRVIPRLQRCD